MDKTYRTAKVYKFSKEIEIYYSVYHDGMAYCVKADYRGMKDNKKGVKTITKRTEKGLRNKKKEEAVSGLEKVAYYKDFYPLIITDIKNRYEDNYNNVTLKTLWFILREELNDETGYDDDLAKKIFENKTISNLYPGKCNKEEIEDNLVNLCEENNELGIPECVFTINLIIEEAKKRGLILEKKKGSKGLKNEIEKALTKAYKENLSDVSFINNLKKNTKEDLIKKICLLEACLQFYHVFLTPAFEDIEFNEIVKGSENE